MSRRILGAASGLGFLLLVAACGSDDESSGPRETPSSGGSSSSGGSTSAGGSVAQGGSTAQGGTSAVGGGKVGDACVTNEDCTDPPDAECFTTIGGGPVPEITFPGGYCSKACDTDGPDDQCGSNGACSSSGVSGGMSSVNLTICLAFCSAPDQCRTDEGYQCAMLLPGFGTCGF